MYSTRVCIAAACPLYGRTIDLMEAAVLVKVGILRYFYSQHPRYHSNPTRFTPFLLALAPFVCYYRLNSPRFSPFIFFLFLYFPIVFSCPALHRAPIQTNRELPINPFFLSFSFLFGTHFTIPLSHCCEYVSLLLLIPLPLSIDTDPSVLPQPPQPFHFHHST